MKLRSFCKAKDTINQTKRQIFNSISDRRLISKIYKEFKKHVKKCSTSLANREFTSLPEIPPIKKKKVLKKYKDIKLTIA